MESMLSDEFKNCEKAMGLLQNYFLPLKKFLKNPNKVVYKQIIFLLVTNLGQDLQLHAVEL